MAILRLLGGKAARRLVLVMLVMAAASAPGAPAVSKEAITLQPMRLPVTLEDGRSFELEAMVVKPSGAQPRPLALITHGSPRDGSVRRRISAGQMSFQAEELARRGYVAVVVMRRGYGTSAGAWAESSGHCEAAEHERAARESARDLRAALRTLSTWSAVDPGRMIVIGESAGGIGTVALAAEPPRGLLAVINFAGGRGSRGPNDICSEDRLVKAYAALGRTARVPSLWIYSENDLYFGPALAQRMFSAYSSQGGTGEFRLLPAFAEDGHALFSRRAGIAQWRPLLDTFLRQHGLPTWDTPPSEPVVTDLPPPPQLAPRHHEQWQRYLDAADNKAFAVAPGGRFAWHAGFYRLEDAQAAALATCGGSACRLISENDMLTAR